MTVAVAAHNLQPLAAHLEVRPEVKLEANSPPQQLPSVVAPLNFPVQAAVATLRLSPQPVAAAVVVAAVVAAAVAAVVAVAAAILVMPA